MKKNDNLSSNSSKNLKCGIAKYSDTRVHKLATTKRKKPQRCGSAKFSKISLKVEQKEEFKPTAPISELMPELDGILSEESKDVSLTGAFHCLLTNLDAYSVTIIDNENFSPTFCPTTNQTATSSDIIDFPPDAEVPFPTLSTTDFNSSSSLPSTNFFNSTSESDPLLTSVVTYPDRTKQNEESAPYRGYPHVPHPEEPQYSAVPLENYAQDMGNILDPASGGYGKQRSHANARERDRTHRYVA